MKKIGSTFIFILITNFVFSQWEVKNVIEENRTILTIKFYDNERGFAMGEDAYMLKTSDFGETWNLIENEILGSIMDFEYISLDTILAVSSSFENQEFTRRIYKSIDGGFTWNVKYEEEGDISCIQSINSQTIISSGSSKILKSIDGGENWTTVFNILENGFDFGSIRKVEMLNDSIGYGIGTGKETNDTFSFYSYVLRTMDGGENWEIFSVFDDWLHELDFVTTQEGFISDSRYTYKTEDAGMTWDTLTNNYGVVGFSIPSKDKMITVNRPGAYIPEATSTFFAISQSTDFGNTWEGEYQAGAHMETVYFLNDSIGYVAGDYGIIMKTENCGGEITGNYPWHLFTTSIHELKETKLEFYPNPTRDKLFVRELDSTADWNYSIETFNGISIKKGIISNLEIDVSDIPQGLFILILQKGKNRKIGKFMKL